MQLAYLSKSKLFILFFTPLKETGRTLLVFPSPHFVLFSAGLGLRRRSSDPNLLPCQDGALQWSGWPSLKRRAERLPSGGRKEGKTCRFEPARRVISSSARDPHGSPGRLWTGATSSLSSICVLVQTSTCNRPPPPPKKNTTDHDSLMRQRSATPTRPSYPPCLPPVPPRHVSLRTLKTTGSSTSTQWPPLSLSFCAVYMSAVHLAVQL